MYSIRAYGEMIADRVRMEAYRRALERTVHEGMHVLDLGAGSGIMTLLACRLGAGRVIAVEPNNLISVAREMVAAAGWDARVELIHDQSTAVATPHPCDVVVSDLRGVLPLFGRHIPTIVDARARWLREGGTLIPRQDTIYAAVVESPRSYQEQFGGWLRDTDGFSFAAARRLCANWTRKVDLEEQELLSGPAPWTTLDYRAVTSADHEGDIALPVVRDGIGHGLVLWFESVLVDDVHLSNRPGHPKAIYGQQFLPWPEPVALRAGDTVDARLRARLIGDDYVWSWTSILPRDGTGVAARVTFDQSTFQGEAWTPELLARMNVRARPELTERGRAASWALSAMDGSTPTEDIAQRLAAGFPDQFPDALGATRFISSLHAAFWR